MPRSYAAIAVLAVLATGSGVAIASVANPASGSPSGALYELPVDKGRSDAAPHPHGTAPNPQGGGTGAGSGSLYRSDNNFGASSVVPGAAAPKTGSGGSVSAAGVGLPSDPGAPSGGGADTGNTSVVGGIGLLALLGGAGCAVGFFALRGRSRL